MSQSDANQSHPKLSQEENPNCTLIDETYEHDACLESWLMHGKLCGLSDIQVHVDREQDGRGTGVAWVCPRFSGKLKSHILIDKDLTTVFICHTIIIFDYELFYLIIISYLSKEV